MVRRTGLVAAAALVAALLPPALATPARCDVWVKGPWATFRPARFDDLDAGTGSRYDAAEWAHVLAFDFGGTFPGGQRARTFVSDGYSVARTVDGGCTWQTGYSLDPRAAANAVADPAVLPPAADAEYGITSFAAGRDTVVALAQNQDSLFAGLAVNAAGQPTYVAHSGDGGATWHTDVFQAKLDGAPVATPVLGSGLVGSLLAVSPADPRTVFAVLDTRDPRAQAAPKVNTVPLQWRALYVSHDAGATWSFAAPVPDAAALVADPAASGTAWLRTDGMPDRLTAVDTRTGAVRTVYTAPSGAEVTGLDVVGGAGRPTRLVLTVGETNRVTKRPDTVFYTSADAGRSWTRLVLPHGIGAVLRPVGAARLTDRGDLLAVLGPERGNAAPVLYRWAAARRSWTTSTLDRVPLAPGYGGFLARDLLPVEASHRYFLVLGQAAAGTTYAYFATVYDTRLG